MEPIFFQDGSFLDVPRMSALLLYTVYEQKTTNIVVKNVGRRPLPTVVTTFAPPSARNINFVTAELHLPKNGFWEKDTSSSLTNNAILFHHDVVFLVDAPQKLAIKWAEAWNQFLNKLVVVANEQKYERFPTVTMNGLNDWRQLDMALHRVFNFCFRGLGDEYSPPVVKAESRNHPLFIYYSEEPVTKKNMIEKMVFRSFGEPDPKIEFVDQKNNPFKAVPGEPQEEYMTNVLQHYMAVVHLVYATSESRIVPYLRFGKKNCDFFCDLNNKDHIRRITENLFHLKMQNLKPFR